MPVSSGFRSGPSFQLDMAGIQQTSQMLRDAAARGWDMRPAMTQIKALLIEGHTEQFSSQGGFLGTPWPPNSPETLLRKAREGVPSLSKPMVATGDLQESLAGGKGARSRVTKGSVSVGTSLFYAIFAIKGASGKGANSAASRGARKGSEPARPPVGINQAEIDESLSIMERHLMRGSV